MGSKGDQSREPIKYPDEAENLPDAQSLITGQQWWIRVGVGWCPSAGHPNDEQLRTKLLDRVQN